MASIIILIMPNRSLLEDMFRHSSQGG